MAVSVCRHATSELSADLCVPGNGDWALWNSLSGSGARAGARLAAGSVGPGGKGVGSDRVGEINLEWPVAGVDDRVVDHKRFYLVDSVFDLSLRCLATVPADGAARRPLNGSINTILPRSNLSGSI